MNTKPSVVRTGLGALLVLLASLCVFASLRGTLFTNVRAQSIWQDDAAAGDWNNAASWIGGVPNAIDAQVVFRNTSWTTDKAVTVVSSTLGFLLIDGSNLTGRTLSLDSGGLTFQSTGATPLSAIVFQGSNIATVNSAINMANDLQLIMSAEAGTDAEFYSGTITLAGAITTNGHNIFINSSNAVPTAIISGAISGGPSHLHKYGAGKLVLSSANNTFAGGLDIQGGRVETTVRNAAGAGIVIGGGIVANANNLGAGDIMMQGRESVLQISSNSTFANQYVSLNGGLLDVDERAQFILLENDYRNNFVFNLNSGTLSGGSYGEPGVYKLSGVDLSYNANGAGGSAFINTPELILDTSRNATAMKITLNNTAMQSGLGVVRKIGDNGLVFAPGDTGTFKSSDFFVESLLGNLSLNQSILDITNGMTISGTASPIANQFATTRLLNFGRNNQLSSLTISPNVTANLVLHNGGNAYSQTFSNLNIGAGAGVGIIIGAYYPTPYATPSTLNLGGLSFENTSDALTIYNWSGLPYTHAMFSGGTTSTLTAGSGNVVSAAGFTAGDPRLAQINFGGFASGAKIVDGNLVPSDVLRSAVSGGGDWFNEKNWTAGVPTINSAGSQVTVNVGPANTVSLGGRAVSVGNLVLNVNNAGHYSNHIVTGTMIFDSGMMVDGIKASSTISGPGGYTMHSGLTVVLKNDLVIKNNGSAGDSALNASLSLGVITGTGNITTDSNGWYFFYESNPNFSGNVNIRNGRLYIADGNVFNADARAEENVLTIYRGDLRGHEGIIPMRNKTVIAGNFTTNYITYAYEGDIALGVNPTISTAADVYFSQATRLVDAAGQKNSLTISGNDTTFLGGNNTYSGGFNKTGGDSTVYADLHSDLVTGRLSPDNNYLGIGSISVINPAGANWIEVTNNGYDSYIDGRVSLAASNTLRFGGMHFAGTGSTVISGTVNAAGHSRVWFDGAAGIIDSSAAWTTTAGAVSRIYAGNGLAINSDKFTGGTVDIYSRPVLGDSNHITTTLANGIVNINTLRSEKGFYGTTYLDAVIRAEEISPESGVLVLNGSDLVKPRTGTTVATTLNMAGGILQTAAGSSGSPSYNKFKDLSLTANSGIIMGDYSDLYFTGVGAWSSTNDYQLQLTNVSGVWSTLAAPTAGNTHVYFSDTSAFGSTDAWRLDYISFTGYDTGALLLPTNIDGADYWFLAPRGNVVSEWLGSGGSGVPTDRLWFNAANWVGDVPNGAGQIATIRNADGLLEGDVIIVNDDVTLGKLALESAGNQTFDIVSAAGKRIIFDSGEAGTNAVLVNQNPHLATVSADLDLESDVAIRQVSTGSLTLSGQVTGNGGMIVEGSGVLVLSTTNAGNISANDFAGGVRLIGSTATTDVTTNSRVLALGANGTLFGTGSIFGDGSDASLNLQALTVGDGTPGLHYTISTTDTAAPRIVDGSVRIAGNIAFRGASGTNSVILRSDTPGYITSGTWTLSGTGRFDMPLQGPGGLFIPERATIGFAKTSAFEGDVTLSGYYTRVDLAADNALGAGKIIGNGTRGGGDASGIAFLAVGGTRTLSNEFVFNNEPAHFWFVGGDFILDHSGTSTLAANLNRFDIDAGLTTRIVASHTLAGPGALVNVSEGTLRLEGENIYSGRTWLYSGWLAVGNNKALGTSGTLEIGGAGLASYGPNPITLSEQLVILGNPSFAGVDSVLTMNPAVGAQLTANRAIYVTGTVAFGENLSLYGVGGMTKASAGVLELSSPDSTYTGNTAISGGTLRVRASGDISIGQTVAGENYLGSGDIFFNSANAVRVLELITQPDGNVHLAANMTLTGNSSVNTASVKITDTAGAVSGAGITTYLGEKGDQTIAGNASGYLQTPGNLIKVGDNTLTWTGGNINAPNFIVAQGTLDLGSAALARSGPANLTLGDANVTFTASQTFLNTKLNLNGDAAIDFHGTSTPNTLTFDSFGSTWTGSLDILNWNGNSTSGNSYNQIRFIKNVRTASDIAKLATINFFGTGAVDYVGGARAIKNAAGYFELLPNGVTSLWSGSAGGNNNWSTGNNWIGDVSPLGAGAFATFGDELNLVYSPVDTVNVDTLLTIGGIVFKNNTGAQYSLAGGVIAFKMTDTDAYSVIGMENNNSVTIKTAGIHLGSSLVVSHDGSGTLTLAAQITGTNGLVKSGTGVTVLESANNTFSGGVALIDGTLNLANSSGGAPGAIIGGPLGTGTLTVGGMLAPTLGFTVIGGQKIDNAINLDTEQSDEPSDTLLKLNAIDGNTTTLNAPVTQTGAGLAAIEKTGDGTLVLAGANTYTGTTTVTGGTLRLGADDAIASSTAVAVNAVLSTGDRVQTINHLAGTGHIIAGADNNDATGVVVARNDTRATTFSGSITGDGSLVKTGPQTLTLAGNNAYTGTTNIIGGTLLVDGDNTLATGAFHVQTGAIVGGAGAIGGKTTIHDGGAIAPGDNAPGDNPGILTFADDLILNPLSQLNFELGKPTTPAGGAAGVDNDLINLTSASGTLVLDGQLNVVGGANFGIGIYRLINYSGAMVNNGLDFASLTGNTAGLTTKNFYVQTDIATQVNLVYTADLRFRYWDGAGTPDDNALQGGAGTWDSGTSPSSNRNWAMNVFGNANNAWDDGMFAIFGAGSNPAAGDTVTIDNTLGDVRFAGAQFLVDGYTLAGGTLTITNTSGHAEINTGYDGTAASAAITATLNTLLVGSTGTEGLKKTGLGTLEITSAQTYTGTTHIAAGAIVMSNTAAIGSGAAHIADAATLRVATGSTTFGNTLAGSGLLDIALKNATDAFAFANAATGAAFTGAARFGNSAYALDNSALANATVILGAGNTTTVTGGTQQLGALAIDGAALNFAYATGTQAAGIIKTAALDAIGGTLNVTGATGNESTAKPLLQQDEGTTIRLIEATAVTGTNLTLPGGATAKAAVKNATAVTTATATYTQTLDYTTGLVINYNLAELALIAGQTTQLDGDTAAPAGAAELHALITGDGNLQIAATGAITLNNGANNYTGTTTVTQGTLLSGADNALGSTSQLKIAAGAAYDLNAKSQTIQTLDTLATSTLALNTGTLTLAAGGTSAGALTGAGLLNTNGLLAIQGANAGLAATLNITGTTTIDDASGLGDTGAANIAASSALVANSVTGDLSKQLAGTGTLSLVNSSSVTLTGANTPFAGALATAPGTRLTVTEAANIGGATRIDNAGQFAIDTTTDWTMPAAAQLAGAGSLLKLNTGTLTIANAHPLFLGASTISAGAVKLTDLSGLGTGVITNNARLLLNQDDGIFTNTVLGTGTTIITDSRVFLNGNAQNLVYVAPAGILAGTGTAADVTLQGGTFQPGMDSTAVFTIDNNLTISDGAILDWILNQPAPVIGAPDNDHVYVGGTTIMNSGTVNVTPDNFSAFGPGIYHLITTQNHTGSGLVAGGVWDGAQYVTFDTLRVRASGTLIDLIYTRGYDIAFWDGAGPQDDNTLQGGSGIWQGASGTMTWSDTTTPAYSANAPWKDGALAIFGYEKYAHGAANPGTVTVASNATSGAVIVGAMQFLSSGYLLDGDAIVTGGTDTLIWLNTHTNVSATIANTITGTLGIAKTGLGHLTLTGSSNYQGDTRIYGGKLTVNGYLGSGTSIVTATNATLAGNGTIADLTRIATGATLAPDGKLTITNTLAIETNSTIAFDLATPDTWGGAGQDHIDVTGDLTIAPNSNLALNSAAPLATGLYHLVSYTGALTYNQLNLLYGNTGLTAADSYIQTSIARQINLVHTGTADEHKDPANTSAFINWDGGGLLNDGAISGGSGTWQAWNIQNNAANSHENWTNATGGANSMWKPDGYALFGGLASGTVTIDNTKGPVTASGLNFDQSGYVLDGAPLTLSGTNNITIGGAATGTTTINAPLAETAPGAGITKTGAGTLVLAGLNTYTGTTTLARGRLLINGVILGETIADAGLLGGSGRIDGPVAINTATLAPTGTLTTAALTLAPASITAFDLGANGNDLVNANGPLTLDGTLNVAANGAFATGAYRLFNYAIDSLTDATMDLGILPTANNQNYFIQTANPGQVNLVYIADAQRGAVNYWDGARADYATVEGGDGAWSDWASARDNWTTSAGTLNAPWQDYSYAMFTATAGTVTISSTATLLGATFTVSGYQIQSGELRLGGTTSALIEVRTGAATIASLITGSDAVGLTKAGAGTLILAAANAYTGSTTITTGTLALAAAGAAGAGDITTFAPSALVAAYTGALANNIVGQGTAIIAETASIDITGTNTIAQWNIAGSGTIGGTQNLGSGNVNIDGRLVARTASPWVWSNTLTGAGLLAVNTTNNTLDFSGATGAAFTGTVSLAATTMHLGSAPTHASNAATLANSTLRLLAGSTLATHAETRRLGGLDMGAGSVTALEMNGLAPATVLQTGTLAVNSASRLAFEGYANGTPVISTTTPKNFIDQDVLGANATLLIATQNLLAPDVQVAITQADGVTPLTGGRQIDYDAVIATYNYTGLTASASTAYNAVGSATAGLYYDYLLTLLDIKSGTTLVLDSTTAADATKTLSTEVTGAGSLEIIAGDGSLTLSHSNSYTGTTTITSGTLIAGATDALGRTAFLVVTETAAYNLNGNTQTIANGATIDGALHGTGSLGLGGLATITSANADFAADVGVTGATTINNTAALGNTGAITATGELILDNATGALAKQIAGTGTISLVNTSSVALTGANTLGGEWNIAQNTALAATSTANLGAAAIVDNGLFTIANATEETLANTLAGAGALVKNAAGNLIISQSNPYAGVTTINGGTLTAQNLGATGTGNVTNNAALDLAGTGDYSNNISGAGTTFITAGGVNITGANNTVWHITPAGSGTISGTQNLGPGNVTLDGVLVARSASPWVWTNTLAGAGILEMDTATLDFANTTGTAFRGTLDLRTAAFTLAGDNTAALAGATLRIDENASVTTGSGVQQIGNLTLASGTLAFTLADDGATAEGIIRANVLDVRDTVIVIDTRNMAAGALPLLQQDEKQTIALVEANTLAGAPRQITGDKLVDHHGAQITDATRQDIIQNNDLVASGTYDYAALAGNTGLRLAYELTALDLLAGKTTTLNEDNAILAGANELHATVSGQGNLAIDATDAITLNGANTYTGATLVNTGALISGVNEALGQTSRLDIAAGATWNLDGKTQTIANGGRIDGHITGGGALTLSAGTMTITSANTAYAAATDIAAPATAHIKDAASLGASAIRLDGILKLDTAASGAMLNTLAGSGALQKLAAGAVTLPNGSPAFDGTAQIQAGRLVAARIDSLGTARVTVGETATFEQTNMAGTLQNALAGSGAHLVTSGTIAIADAAGYKIANTTLNQPSVLALAANNITLGTLQMNNGALSFMTPAGAASIATLGNTSGNILMNANFANLTANHLEITNAGAAAHAIYVNPLAEPAGQNFAIEVINTINPGSATFILANNAAGVLEYELTAIKLLRGDGTALTPDANKWYLTDRALSNTADTIINTASTLALDWAYALDALHLRMGEVRAENIGDAARRNTGNVWVRSRGYRLNAANQLSGLSFEQYGWGVTGGADKAFETESGTNLLGGFIDMGGVNRRFDNSGTGETNNVALGLYATVIKNNGWFLDALARFDRYSNSFDAKSHDNKTTHGEYTAKGQSLSLEAGRRLTNKRGWWIEPGIQAAVLWLNGASYETQARADQRAIKIDVNDSETWQYRALVRFGKQIKNSRWSPYGKFAAVAVDSNGGAIKAQGKTFDTDYDGKRIEFGAGASYRLNNVSQIYADYEYAKASAYERPWSLNLGYRRLW